MSHIAVIGLGIMGSGMARNLLKGGHTVTVYNRTRARAEELVSDGAAVAESPRAAAQNADVILSMISDDHASRAVWLGKNGALEAAKPNALLIESATLSPAWVRELGKLAAAHGCLFLDAPVTGSKPQAANGELGFFVGGDAETLERARPYLELMGNSIHHLGPTGSGAMYKLINNLIGGVEQTVLVEAIALAEASGLDMKQVVAMLSDSPVAPVLFKRKLPQLMARNYQAAFSLRLMHKDLTYVLSEAADRNIPLPTVSAAREIMRIAIAQGMGEQDVMALRELFQPAKE
jgi:3-hydroxyisobutyrate dehydrogenase